MNFLKTKTSWSYLELGIIKLCLIAGGVALGSYFHEFFLPYALSFLLLYLSLALIILPLWISKKKQ